MHQPLPPTSGINYVLLKLASRCNLDCTYCYWFRDPEVRTLPPLMTQEVIDAFVVALRDHIALHRLAQFTCSFHGGEPLLFGAPRLRTFLQKIDQVAKETHCDIRYALTTNGVLIDPEWVTLISEFEISVTVSIDGPPAVHDARRLTVKGRPSWRESVEGYLALCRAGISPTIIAVCDPRSDPAAVLDHLAGELGVRFCDILMPDANHDDAPDSIAEYYIRLFDHWYDKYWPAGVEVRILHEIVRVLLGLESHTESIGLSPTRTVCLSPTGILEPHDVLRIAGAERVRTSCSIFSHAISDIEQDPVWSAVRDASVRLPASCTSCRYQNACGGGHIAQRWSRARGYDNESVYCKDIIAIFDHVAGRLKDDVRVRVAGDVLQETAVQAVIRSGGLARLMETAA